MLEEIERFADVGKGNLLRRGHDDTPSVGDGIQHGQMFITRAGRGIDDQIVQSPPLYVGQKLSDGPRFLGAAPEDRRVLILQEGIHGNKRHALTAGNGQHFAVFVSHDGRGSTQQAGHARPMNIHIKDADRKAARSQSSGKIDRYGTLAHAPLAAHDEQLVAHILQILREYFVLHSRGHGDRSLPLRGLIGT